MSRKRGWRFIAWLGAVLANCFMIFNTSYAMRFSDLEWHTTWYNPVTGRLVELPTESHVNSTKTLTTTPGLVWKFSRLGAKVNDSFRIILRRKEYYLIDGPSFQNEVAEISLVKANTSPQNICGQQVQVSKALGDRGREYRVIRFASDFVRSAEKLWVVIVQSPPDYGYSSTDESLFCPLIESFFPKDKQFFILPLGEWMNPLSEKLIVLPMQTQVVVDDIVANDYGFYQAYRLINGVLQIRLQKSLYSQMDAAPDTEDLPKNTVFNWKNTYYSASTFEQAGFSKREAKFKGQTAEGKNIYGVAFDYQKKNERVLVKAWRADGFPISDEEQEWVAKIFDSSIPD